METQTKTTARKRKIPDRFGELITIPGELSDDLCSDDSFEDKPFEPPAKIVATIKRHGTNPNKNTPCNRIVPTSTASENFDHLFEQIENNSVANVSTAKNKSQDIEIVENNINRDEILKLIESSKSEMNSLRELVLVLNNKSDQILARISIMESQMIDNDNSFNRNTVKYTENEIERTQCFLKSINLPISTNDIFNKFESDLTDTKFYSAVVIILNLS